MGEWKLIKAKAEQAKKALMASPAEGEKQFDALFILYPGDGMVSLKRAEAFEGIGRPVEASEDYQQALARFPMPYWKGQAREGLERCQTAKPTNRATISDDVTPANHEVSIDELGRWRRTIMAILDSVEAQTEDGVSEKAIQRRITDLSFADRLPRNVAGWMKALTEQRNVSEYQRKTLSLPESNAARANWDAIYDWAIRQGYLPKP